MIEVESVGSFNSFDSDSEHEEPARNNGKTAAPLTALEPNGSKDASKIIDAGSEPTSESPPTYTFSFQPVQRMPSAFQPSHPALDESCEAISSIDAADDHADLLAEEADGLIHESADRAAPAAPAEKQHAEPAQEDGAAGVLQDADVEATPLSCESLDDDPKAVDGVLPETLPAEEAKDEATPAEQPEHVDKADMAVAPAAELSIGPRASSFATAASERACEVVPELVPEPEAGPGTEMKGLSADLDPAATTAGLFKAEDGKLPKVVDHVEAALDELAFAVESPKSAACKGDTESTEDVPQEELDKPQGKHVGDSQEEQPQDKEAVDSDLVARSMPETVLADVQAPSTDLARTDAEEVMSVDAQPPSAALASEEQMDEAAPATQVATEEPPSEDPDMDTRPETVNNLDSLFEEVAQIPAQVLSTKAADMPEEVEQVVPKSPSNASEASAPSHANGHTAKKPNSWDAESDTDSFHKAESEEEVEKPAQVVVKDEVESSLLLPQQHESLQVVEGDDISAKEEPQVEEEPQNSMTVSEMQAVSEGRDDDSVSVMDIQEVQESTKERFYELFSKTSHGATVPETIIVGKETSVPDVETQQESDQLVGDSIATAPADGEVKQGDVADPISEGLQVQLVVTDADESSLRLAGAEASPPMLGFDERVAEEDGGTGGGPSAPDIEPPPPQGSESPSPGPPALSDSVPCLTTALGSPNSEDPCVCFSTMQNLDAHAEQPPPIYSVDQDISEGSDSSSNSKTSSPTTEDDDGSDSCEPLVQPQKAQEQQPEEPEVLEVQAAEATPPPPPPPPQTNPVAPPPGGTVMPPLPDQPPSVPQVAESDAKKRKAKEASNPMASFTKCFGCLRGRNVSPQSDKGRRPPSLQRPPDTRK